MSIEEIFRKKHQLSAPIIHSLLDNGEMVKFGKNEAIILEGKVEKSSYILISGCAKAHLNYDGKEVNFWFGFEGDFLLSYNSKILNLPGYESITSLENCLLWKIPNKALDLLCTQNLEIANWWRKLVEKELIKTEKRLIDRQIKDAKTRYEELIQQQPQVLKRISLGNIASYLGINQVTLSRIRRQVQ